MTGSLAALLTRRRLSFPAGVEADMITTITLLPFTEKLWMFDSFCLPINLLRVVTVLVLGTFAPATNAQETPSPDQAGNRDAGGISTLSREIVQLTDRGREIHFSGMLFDGHNDLPWEVRKRGKSSFEELDIATAQPELHTDIPRLRQGGLKAQFWSVYVPADTAEAGQALIQTLEQIDIVDRMVERYDSVFEMASTADDIQRIAEDGKIACMMGIEGGHSIENSLANLQRLYDRGCRYMTLTHSKTLPWADSATDELKHNGLTEFGIEVVREMNRLGMLVDLSHVSPQVMKQAIEISSAPIIFSHSSAFALSDHPRNVPDDVLRRVKDNGGVVMVNFYSKFVIPSSTRAENEKARGSIHDVVDHIDHIAKVAGVSHVGIGSDFDGVPQLPVQLEDVSKYPLITQELLNRGYSRAEIHQILGGNMMRVLRGAEAAAEIAR